MKPVVCRDLSHEQGREIQRQNSESEQVRTLLDRQSEQILDDCQAEIRKHCARMGMDVRAPRPASMCESFLVLARVASNLSSIELVGRAPTQSRSKENHQENQSLKKGLVMVN